jgi:hypothetical protein
VEIKEILSKLEYNTGSFQDEAVKEAIRQKDKIIPELLEILKHANENIMFIEEHPKYIAHIYSMFLLAQFREKRAYSLIVNLFSNPGKDYDRIAGDFVTEYLPRVLASVCHGDTTLIKKLIENREIDEWVRVGSLHALVTLVASGKKSREEVMNYYKNLFQGKLERETIYAWGTLVACCCHLHPAEVYEDIKRAYEDKLVDSFFIDMEDVQQYLDKSWNELHKDLRNDVHHSLIDDTISNMEWWACFQTEEQKKKKMKKRKKQMIEYGEKTQRKKKKIGRNEPCPCGSGKKYKKCCGAIIKPQNKF